MTSQTVPNESFIRNTRKTQNLSCHLAHTPSYFLSDPTLSLSPEHDHGLLADIVWVLGHDEVDVLLLDPQLPAQAHPVPAQQVGDVGDAQVGPVDGVKLAVAGLTQEAVLSLHAEWSRWVAHDIPQLANQC